MARPNMCKCAYNKNNLISDPIKKAYLLRVAIYAISLKNYDRIKKITAQTCDL